ncbi:putative CDP-alcohol phosphatidyltransferase class-I family protein 3 [Smittium mucronatum]|uniref:Putative CDP-alcohol phosphatidyltransferase class-I family protein 3 n=1 Tax=Smittium mucronatum TaxID=133383 RepID=A0A1R0GYK9_9FUNG|nr:putative CDP-alcohol phosphatidyltransferase class-I family protein 3 [Smittium mucronatum]
MMGLMDKLEQAVQYIMNKLPSGAEYVNEESLKNLKLYKYSAVDKSYLTKYVLSHYWNWAVTLFPLWMAFGLGMWLYSTFDNVDGKQARRTNSSSPLGELFDHGCDALNCTVGVIVQAAAFGTGISMTTLFMAFLTTTTFYLTTWEEYHTGTMYLGYVNGPTEFIVLAVLACFMSGIFGPQIWSTEIVSILPFMESILPTGMSLIQFLLAITFFLVIFVVGGDSIRHAYQASKNNDTPFMPKLLQFIPFFILISSCYLWVSTSKIILAHNHLILFLLTAGTAFGRITSKIILAHLIKGEFPYYTVQMIPLAVGAVLSMFGLFSPITELVFLWTSFVFVMVAYLHWAYLVVDIFCTFLGIQCFSIAYSSPSNL